MLYSTSGERFSNSAMSYTSERPDVTLVRTWMNRNARSARRDAHGDSFEHVGFAAASRVAQRRNLVNVRPIALLTASTICRRPPVDLLQILSFQHHAQERLGARVAHEQASVAAKLLLHICHDGGDVRESTSSSRFSLTRTFNSTCG